MKTRLCFMCMQFLGHVSEVSQHSCLVFSADFSHIMVRSIYDKILTDFTASVIYDV